jgi:hypothetical protein
LTPIGTNVPMPYSGRENRKVPTSRGD